MGGVMSVPEIFCWNFAQMIQYTNEYLCKMGQYVHWGHAGTSYHSYARNQLVTGFMGEWLLMLDTDHSFEPDLVCRMVAVLQQYKLDVLTGLYVFKAYPHMPNLFHWNGEGYIPIGKWHEKAVIFEVGSAGGGVLMVRRSVFDRIVTELHEQPFDHIVPWSEDFSFFKRCERLGIKAYCCPAIESKHLVIQPIGINDYVPDMSRLGPAEMVGGAKEEAA